MGAVTQFVFDSIDSTQDEVFRKIDAGIKTPFAVLAREQMKGRGRLDRVWVGERDRSLLLSLGWVTSKPLGLGLSLVVGLGLRRVLGDDLRLKWPNDLMQQDEKIGGVLIESRSLRSKTSFAIGVGLNLKAINGGLYAGLERETPIDVEALLATLIEMIRDFEAKGFSQFQKDYESCLWRRDDYLNLHIDGQNHRVEILGVDKDGALLSREDGRIRMDINGELSFDRSA